MTPKRVREFLTPSARLAQALGLELGEPQKRRRSGHYTVPVLRQGKVIGSLSMPGTPGDRRGALNTAADLRRLVRERGL